MKKMILPLIVAIGIIAFIWIGFFNVEKRTQITTGALITQEVEKLRQIFEQINKDCTILDFDFQKNPINFLNVKTFSGSEVGPMNLVYPKKWRGPYVPDNPTMQDKEYQIVRTKMGYYITPGDGVKLPNGKIIGKDIILNEDADITVMMQDDNALRFEGRSLAAPLSLDQRSSLPVNISPEDT